MYIASLVTAQIQWNTLGDWKFSCTIGLMLANKKRFGCTKKQKKGLWP